MSTERIAEIRERKIDGLLATHGCGAWIALSPKERDWLLTRLEDAREVMEEIAESYYEQKPLSEGWAKKVADCEECTRRRDNVHFPTNWCNDHYCQMAAHNEQEERAKGNHDITLRHAARRWLEGEE